MQTNTQPRYSSNWISASRHALLAMSSGVIAMLGLASLIVAASINYAAKAIDLEARKTQEDSIAAGLEVLAEHVGASIRFMSFADDLLQNVTPQPDEQWLRQSFRQRVLSMTEFAVLAILDQNGRPVFDTTPGGKPEEDLTQQLGNVLLDGTRSIRSLINEGATPQVGHNGQAEGLRSRLDIHGIYRYSMWKGVPSLVTFNPIRSGTSEVIGPASWSHLTTVHRLEGEFLGQLRRVTGITTLRWSDNDGIEAGFTQMKVGGSPADFSSLAWVPDRPGAALIERAKPGLFLALGLLLIVAAAVIAGSAFTIRRLALQKLHAEWLASTDQLTGLANRREFNAMMDRLIASEPDVSRGFSLLMIDLDRFKPLNDTYGHDAGDCALKEIAARLGLLAQGRTIAARLGGDEFAMLAPGITGRDAEVLAAKIVASLAAPIDLPGGHRETLGASVGLAEVPVDGTTARDICRRADVALYRAKELGRNTSVTARDMAQPTGLTA